MFEIPHYEEILQIACTVASHYRNLLTHFLPKFHEGNAFTIELILRNLFTLKVNFLFFYTVWRLTYWLRDFSISKVYWQGSNNVLVDLLSPHFSLREL